MKKVSLLVLSLVMIVTLLQPVASYANTSSNKELEMAIKVAKTTLDIPDTLTEFNYDVYTNNNENLWYLRWYSKDSNDGSVSVAVSSDGMIMNYYNYKDLKNVDKKFPNVSYDNAFKEALRFINKVDEDLLPQLRVIENNTNSISNPSYYFRFVRSVNRLPFHENSVEVEVSSETGEIRSFHRNWSKDLDFPEAKNYISLEEAQKIYGEELGLKLVYKYTYDYDKNELKTYLAYVPSHNLNVGIDALTGKKVDFNYYYYPMDGMGRGGDVEAMKSSAAPMNDYVLTPEEVKAVDEASKLMSKEDAEKIARALKEVNLDASFKLDSAYLNRSWPIKNNFTWGLHFSKKEDVNGKITYSNASVTLDASSGKVLSFYVNKNTNAFEEVGKIDREAARKQVEEFLKAFSPTEFEQSKYDDNYVTVDNTQDKLPLNHSFRYFRQVNNIPFENNYIIVNYDAVNGNITSYNLTWFDADFERPVGVMTLDKAHKNLFEKVGFELQYKTTTKTMDTAKLIIPERPMDLNVEARLVYKLKDGKNLLFDAKTGAILNNDGKPFVELKPIVYTDLEGYYAEQEINTLAKYNIGFREEKFNPEAQITQQEFFLLFVGTLGYYVPSEIDDNYINNMYGYLLRTGILKENERKADSIVLREDAVKFIIRALGHEEVASIKGIYNCPFKDVVEQSPELIGHITIAYGLNIVKGFNGSFNPKGELNRAGAAVMIFNYLSR